VHFGHFYVSVYFNHFLGLGGISVFFRFRGYFGHFRGFGRYFAHFRDFGGILVILVVFFSIFDDFRDIWGILVILKVSWVFCSF